LPLTFVALTMASALPAPLPLSLPPEMRNSVRSEWNGNGNSVPVTWNRKMVMWKVWNVVLAPRNAFLLGQNFLQVKVVNVQFLQIPNPSSLLFCFFVAWHDLVWNASE
jgi:hypothetical protein